MPDKISPELYAQLAAAKNKLLDTEAQIKALKKQEEEEMGALRQICPHPVIIEAWSCQHAPSSTFRESLAKHCNNCEAEYHFLHGKHFNNYSVKRFCCVCGVRELRMFSLEQKDSGPHGKIPSPPENEQFTLLAAQPYKSVDCTFRPGLIDKIEKETVVEFLAFPLYLLLQKTEENK